MAQQPGSIGQNVFDFLGTDEPRREAELEQKLIEHLEKFLLELGQGFAFVGRQVHMEVMVRIDQVSGNARRRRQERNQQKRIS